MNVLIVGGEGLIGRAVHNYIVDSEHELKEIFTTTRSKTHAGGYNILRLDLLEPQYFKPPCTTIHFAYLCAGINGFRRCETDPNAWRVNVDGVITVGMQLVRLGAFLIYPSTQAVEWSSHTPYARQRAQVEAVLLATWYAAIVRVGPVNTLNCMDCAKALVSIGLTRQPGVYQWP